MSILGDRLLAVHDALSRAGIPHAFGGAIALAYCTGEPRGTRDIDVNVFVETLDAVRVLASLPEAVSVRERDVAAVRRDDQVRVWWDDTPLDLFFDAHDFHRHAAARVRRVHFEGRAIPVIDCLSLVVFKVMFGRTRDWADIEDMVAQGTFDGDEALVWLDQILGAADAAVDRLRALL